MNWEIIRQGTSLVLLCVGVAFTVPAAIGLLRFRDALERMHAASKPPVVGLMLMLAALFLEHPQWGTFLFLTLIMAMQLITNPIATVLMARQGYRAESFDLSNYPVDELAGRTFSIEPSQSYPILTRGTQVESRDPDADPPPESERES